MQTRLLAAHETAQIRLMRERKFGEKKRHIHFPIRI
jgi:hypothetical protein